MRMLALVLVLTLVVAAGALALSFLPAQLPLAPLATTALPEAHPPPEMSLTAFATGAMRSRAILAYRGGALGDAREFSMTVALVHHPRGDLLIDAGFGRHVDEHARMAPWLVRTLADYRKATPVADQLDAAGYDRRFLAGVLLTHAHWDHVSGLADLGGVPVWVNADERAFIAGGAPLAATAHAMAATLAYRDYAFDGGPYLGFARSHDVWGDGAIVLVPAPGHTPGSTAVFVTLPSGARYAFLGDAVWQTEGLDLPAERPWLSRATVDEDAVRARETVSLLAAIHQRFPLIHMVPTHDARAGAALPQFPASAR